MTAKFEIVTPGSAVIDSPAPTTPRKVSHLGAQANPSADALAKRFPDVARAEKNVERAVRGATLIVNATPVGQHDEAQPVDVALIPKSAAVLDLVYRRGGTPWVRAARGKGIRAADGLPMLLEQGALAFHRWFGGEPDREAMRLALP